MFERKKKFNTAAETRTDAAGDNLPGDAELLKAFCNGDEKSFELLYYRYRNLLFSYLNNMGINNPHEVDEVFEETWLRVIEKASKYRDDGKFSAWLFRIARNIFIDRLRKNKPALLADKDAENVQDEAVTEFSPEKDVGNRDIRVMINRALETLSPEQKEVFLLREEQELSFREIADIQECSLGTVLSRMRYALKKLRLFLTEIDTGGLLK
ncbi:MAG: sigma-70 family RNA polymerase sigma factor [Lentisphaeria bacterium]|nr:sigma-70 family RNA polymerase sigma factor [Lentisphaeria bacterium]